MFNIFRDITVFALRCKLTEQRVVPQGQSKTSAIPACSYLSSVVATDHDTHMA